MIIYYDPDRRPEMTPELFEDIAETGLQPVNVICDEPGARVGDLVGVGFLALAAFLPRAGDRILLQDGRPCEVRRVSFKVTHLQDGNGAARSAVLFPNIYAVAIEKTE